MYIADWNNQRIRKVTVPTQIPTIVPTALPTVQPSRVPSSIPSNTPSRSPSVIPSNTPSRVPSSIPSNPPSCVPSSIPSNTPSCVPSSSPHYVSIITTIAGTGTAAYSGDGGEATSASIHSPLGIVIDSNGNVYFSDWLNHRVRKITKSTGIVTTYAGTGTSSFSGDGGVASSAALAGPVGLSIDYLGTYNIYEVLKLMF